MMDSGKDMVETMTEICRRLYLNGFVTATDGNVSVRLAGGTILTTRSGINKGMVKPADILEVDGSGNPKNPGYRPSTELGMHIYIYSRRPDVNAVVHAHPPYATGFATARLPLDGCLFPEVIVGLGAIPLADYATPSTEEVAASLSPFVKNSDAVLLANHGAVTYGRDLWDAYFKMEKVEHTAKITFIARQLGGEKPLTPEQIEKLRSISQSSYGKDFSGKIACDTGACDNAPAKQADGDEIRELIRKLLNP